MENKKTTKKAVTYKKNTLQGMALSLDKKIQDLHDFSKTVSQDIKDDILKIHKAHETFISLLNKVSSKHDMRAALGGIKGYAELILDDYPINSHIFINIIKDVEILLPFIDRIQSKKKRDIHVPIEASHLTGKILMIDDSQEKHDLIKRQLSYTSYTFLSTLSGQKALEIISQYKPDLILLDLMMPDINGFEVLKHLKDNDNTASIPVLIISSSNETDDVIRALKAGAEDYLPMPLNSVILLTRVNACIQKKRMRDREIHYIRQLNESRLRLEKAIQSIDEGFAIFDGQENIVMFNDKFQTIHRITQNLEKYPLSYENFLRTNVANNRYMIQEPLENISSSVVEKWIETKLALFRQETSHDIMALTQGQWLEIVTNRISGGGTVCLHKDITQRILKEKEDHHKAHYDALTQLANRSYFNIKLKDAMSKADLHHTSLSVLFFDLDGFKAINDTLGHDMGDYILKAVGQTLLKTFRQGDTVARFGGDEFCALVEKVTPRDIETLAKRCMEGIHDIGKRENIDFGVSIGVSFYPQDGISLEAILKAADTAMYKAKHQGKGHYVFFNNIIIK